MILGLDVMKDTGLSINAKNDSFNYQIDGKRFERRFEVCIVEIVPNNSITCDTCLLDSKPCEIPQPGGFAKLSDDQTVRLESLLN